MSTYKIIGKRFLRKFTAPEATPVYAAATDAARIVRELCNVPWEASAARQAEMPPHGDEHNPQNREKFDAALFCAGHGDNMHRAYANAAVYRYALPSAAVGKTLTGLTVRVTSDPYNAAGARVHVFTNATGAAPTNCRTVRGDGDDGQPLADGTVAAGVAPRETKTIKGQAYWYPVTAEASIAPTGGLVLQKYLFVAVVLESYATTRGNWLEGASYADNLVSVTLAEPVSGWTDGETYDLSDEAEREFAVVSGGVMSAMPSGDSGIRALTIQRTGDDFVRNRVVSDTGLFGRPRVEGLRVLDVTSTDTVFREPLFAGAARGVGVLPGLANYRTGNSTINAKHSVVFGRFADGSFPDLPGLLIVATINGANTVIRSSQRLDSLATGDDAVRLAAIKSAIDEDGGIGGAWLGYDTGGVTFQVFLCTRKRHYVGTGGTGVAALSLTWGEELTSVSVGVGTMTDAGGAAFFAPYLRSMTYVQTAGWPLVHDADGKRIGSGIAGGWVSYEGTVTAIRPVSFSSDLDVAAVIVSGSLSSVGGVACSNCAFVRFSDYAAPVVTVPACDADVTPDVYKDFAVSCPCTNAPNVSTFYVTGGFSKLGGVDCKIAAKWTNDTLAPMTLPDGTRPPEFFIVGSFAGSDSSAIWVDDSGAIAAEETATDVWETPKAAVTDAQSAFGLRRLYAALYGGELQATAVAATARPGAAFVVHGDEITVKTADGDVTARRWNLSASVLMIPFSCPRAWAASRIRLSWGAVAATPGAKVNVWLARGAYKTTYPTRYPKALFTGAAATVDGWTLVGTLAPTDGVAGSATLDVAPITDDVATLLITAYIDQDDVNPSADLTLPRGVGALDVDAVAGTTSGLDGGFVPDVTLLG